MDAAVLLLHGSYMVHAATTQQVIGTQPCCAVHLPCSTHIAAAGAPLSSPVPFSIYHWRAPQVGVLQNAIKHGSFLASQKMVMLPCPYPPNTQSHDTLPVLLLLLLLPE